MTLAEQIQEGIKQATKDRLHLRLETLRLAKAAILVKAKESHHEDGVSDEEVVAALRAEVRKRQQSMETYRQVGRQEMVGQLEAEIVVLEEFLPKQFSEADLEAKVRAHLAEHPEVNHAGKLTGAMKKELGDLADGKVLMDVCKRVLGQ